MDVLPTLPDMNAPFGLSVNEKFWMYLQPFLEKKGYMLRPRYRPGWVGSWVGKNIDPLRCEDSIQNPTTFIMDATRMADNTQVMLKWLLHKDSPELRILRVMSSEPFASNPRNHCIPLLDIFPVEDVAARTHDWQILVFPFFKDWQMMPILLVTDELMSLVKQLLEGLAFMHSNNIAHRDIERPNILMDARKMYPQGFHGAYNYNYNQVFNTMGDEWPRFTRLQVPVKYYYIDFGLSSIFPSEEDRKRVQFQAGLFEDLPELEANRDAWYDPFKADVYTLGVMLESEFLSHRRGPEFLRSLLTEMMQRDPDKRPTAAHCLSRFEKLAADVPFWRRLAYVGFSQRLGWKLRFDMVSHYLQLLWQAIVFNNRCRY